MKRQVHKNIQIHKVIKTDRQKDRKILRQTERNKESQKDRETEGWEDAKTQREREWEREMKD